MSAVPDLVPKALPAGSPLWWSLAFTETDRRPAVRALLAVRGELLEAAVRPSEPGVAAVKLAWWREEAKRFGTGGEQHPATRSLAASAGGGNVEPEYLEELVDGAAMDAGHTPYASLPELRLYCQRTSGVLQGLIADVVGPSSPGTERALRRAAQRVGIGVRLAELAWGYREDLRAGRLYLPGDWAAEAGIAAGDLTTETPGAGLRGCLERLAGEAEADVRAGLAALPDAERDRHRGLAILAALSLRRLAAARSRGWTAPGPRRRVGAAADSLAELATAWRAARLAARGRTETA